MGGVNKEARLRADLLVDPHLPLSKARPHFAKPFVAKLAPVLTKGAFRVHIDAAEASFRNSMSTDRHGENDTPDAASTTPHGPEELRILATINNLLVNNSPAMSIAANLQKFNLEYVINAETHRRRKGSVTTAKMESSYTHGRAPS